MDSGLGSWVAGRAFRDGAHVALVDGDTGRRRTYRELHDRTSALADALHRSGVRRGDRVALLAMNSPEFLEVVIGVAKLGAITVPVNYRLSGGEVRYVLEDAGASVLFHSEQLSETAASAAHGLRLRRIIEIPSAASRAAGTQSAFEDFLATGSPEPLERDVAGSDVCIVMYTSGTTGSPKGAMLTHDNLLWQAIHALTLAAGLHRSDVTITPAPLFHIGGLAIHTLPLMYVGGTTVTLEAFDAARTAALMAQERATVQFLVPAMWAAVAAVPELDSLDLSALKSAISGGAPTPLPLLEFFQARGWPFAEGFGMAETSPSCSVLPAEHVRTRAGSIGLPLTHVQWRLVDEADADVPAGVVGELVLRGPNVFVGYWGRPRETAEAMRGGWFHTGDLGRADADGFVTLVDRKKDMIITGGENVYPVEVEQVLYRHPDIQDAAVIGLPDDRWGEVVTAVVVPSPALDLTAAELISWTRERLAHFKCPRRIEFVEELPRNATGKLLKRELRRTWSGTDAAVTR